MSTVRFLGIGERGPRKLVEHYPHRIEHLYRRIGGPKKLYPGYVVTVPLNEEERVRLWRHYGRLTSTSGRA